MIDLYDQRTLLRALEQNPTPKTFLLDTFFPTIRQSHTDTVDIDIIKGKRKLAPFVAPVHEGKVIEKDGFHTDSFKPGYIKVKTITTASDLLKRSPGNTIYPSNTNPMRQAAIRVGEDLRRLQEMIVRREEWMASSALSTGKIHIQGDGVNKVIDFQMEPSHRVKLEGNDKWVDAKSDPLQNLRDWQTQIVKDSGLVARTAILGRKAINALLDHKQVRNLLDNRRIQLGQIEPKTLPNGAKYWGTLDDIDLYSYNEWYIDKDGNEQPMISEKHLILGATNARTARHYGVIHDLDATAQVRYFPKSWTTEDPSARYLMLQSAPLVIPHQIDAFMSIQVV